MRVICAQDYDAMSRQAANLISAQVLLKPDCVLGLATGDSPIGAYGQLIRWHRQGDLDFARVKTVNLDEYVGLGVTDPQSYAYFMRKTFFDYININLCNTHIPNGLAPDAGLECNRYDEVIQALGGVDLQLLGLGANGHIGFNEPGTSFVKGTHCVELSQTTIETNARFFTTAELMPRRAFTVGIFDIMQARRVVMIVSGRHKARAVRDSFWGPITPRVPASILQLHRNFTLVADQAALSLVPGEGAIS